MSDGMTRRDALKQLGVAGAALALPSSVVFGQTGDLIVAGQPAEIAISMVSPRVARLIVRQRSGGSDTRLDDGALARPEWGAPGARLGQQTVARVGDLTITLSRAPVRLTIDAVAGNATTRVQTLEFDDAGTLGFNLEGGPVLGFGEGGAQFDRRGTIDRMASGQATFRPPNGLPGYALRTHGGRVPVQWLIGTSGSTSPASWALYIHQPLGTFDLTDKIGRFTPPAGAPFPIDIFVVAARTPGEAMKAFADMTGYAEMPPLWSFGYLQSHRTLSGPDEIQWVARTMREKKLPCDALIYLGTDFTPSGWNTHNGEFTWNEKNFPDPKKMIDDLHAQHFKVVLHIVVEGQRFAGTVADPCTAAPIPPGRTPDNRWPPDRQVSCYWPAHKPLADLGIDGWWPDQGDGYDGVSRLARIRMYWDGSRQFKPNERPFALHRNGYPGMSRFGAFLWSGDVYSTWETLKTHVPVAVNTALSGIPYWGTDIGGFVPTKEFTGELYVRWFQFGAFCPLFRSHGRNWHLRLPWGWNTGEFGISEIANYTGGASDPDPAELHNPNVEPICRRYLELRSRLTPYLYSAVRECSQTGMPILRAMWLHYPDDPMAVARGDQYLWGRDLLVAPVVEQGATSRKVYLPKGAWYDFWTETRLDGGREIERAVDLATVPIYARAGTILPMGPVRQYTGEPVDGPLAFVVYPGAAGNVTVYEDDGISFAYRNGTWTDLVASWNDGSKTLTIRTTKPQPSQRRPIDVRLAGSATTKSVVFAGRSVDVKF